MLRDPHTHSWGTCPFLALTGHPCPACGGLRAANDLAHGDVTAALSSNAYAVGTAVLLGVAWVIWVRRRQTNPTAPFPTTPRVLTWWLVGLVAFGVLRFVPGLTGLQP